MVEITLTKEDIEALIKEQYVGVSEVKCKIKNFKIVVVVKDLSQFTLKRNNANKLPPSTETIVPKEKTLEEKKNEAVSKGLMVPGGSERAIRRIG